MTEIDALKKRIREQAAHIARLQVEIKIISGGDLYLLNARVKRLEERVFNNDNKTAGFTEDRL